MGDYPVHPTSVHPGFLRRQLPADAPSRPELDAFGAALRDVRDLILPGLTHWQSPRHLAHFPASSSTVAALGEALTAGINVVPFTWTASPAATELEMVVVYWLGKALHLPETLLFCGGGGDTLLGTTCEAILCALVAARERKLAEVGATRIGDLVVYCSDQTHFAFRKAAHIAGIHRDNCREIATSRDDMFALSPAALRAAMRADADAGLVPLFLCARRWAPPRPPPWTPSASSAPSRQRTARGSTWTRPTPGRRSSARSSATSSTAPRPCTRSA
jgi:tyrosine decarboxylase